MIIQNANDIVFAHVEGWVGGRIHQMLDFVNTYHGAHGVQGDVIEIGVHHGKLFFLMLSLLRDNEVGIAMDLFSSQHLNIDRSGSGSRAIFEEHLRRYFSEYESSVRIIEGDSMAMRADDIRSQMMNDRVRVFSVDGGHNVEHAINDLSLAQELIAPRGIVMLDDFLGPHWPSVTEGFFKFMNTSNIRLAPYLIFENKLFLTTYSEHESMLHEQHAYVTEAVGDEMHSRWKYTQLCGFKVLSCA